MSSTLGPWKVCLVGNAGAGKSSILFRFTTQKEPPDPFAPTIMGYTVQIKYHSKTLKKDCNLELWDTYGEEKFRALQRMFYQAANAVLIVFHVQDPRALHSIQSWVKELYDHHNPDLCIIVGSKCDIITDDYRYVLPVKQYAQTQGLKFRLVSAKCDIGIDELFDFICSNLHKHPSVLPPATQTPIRLTDKRFHEGAKTIERRKKSGCSC